jgi:hypothetical protein
MVSRWSCQTANGRDEPQVLHHFVEELDGQSITDNEGMIMLGNAVVVKQET